MLAAVLDGLPDGLGVGHRHEGCQRRAAVLAVVRRHAATATCAALVAEAPRRAVPRRRRPGHRGGAAARHPVRRRQEERLLADAVSWGARAVSVHQDAEAPELVRSSGAAGAAHLHLVPGPGDAAQQVVVRVGRRRHGLGRRGWRPADPAAVSPRAPRPGRIRHPQHGVHGDHTTARHIRRRPPQRRGRDGTAGRWGSNRGRPTVKSHSKSSMTWAHDVQATSRHTA